MFSRLTGLRLEFTFVLAQWAGLSSRHLSGLLTFRARKCPGSLSQRPHSTERDRSGQRKELAQGLGLVKSDAERLLDSLPWLSLHLAHGSFWKSLPSQVFPPTRLVPPLECVWQSSF